MKVTVGDEQWCLLLDAVVLITAVSCLSEERAPQSLLRRSASARRRLTNGKNSFCPTWWNFSSSHPKALHKFWVVIGKPAAECLQCFSIRTAACD